MRAILLLLAPVLLLVGCGRRSLPAAMDAGLEPAPARDAEAAADAWQCFTKADGRHFCRRVADDGLPPFGAGWLCHLAFDGAAWLCHAPSTNVTGDSGGWSCQQQGALVRCERDDRSGRDRPPLPGLWVCVKGNIYGGTLCERVAQQSGLVPWPSPVVGMPCVAGQRAWCDGPVYDGWGQVACDESSGTWSTVWRNGQQVLDCREELAGGKAPLTRCACFHVFGNRDCCERLDCIVPDNTSGQLCPRSAGGTCDYCNPMNPECTAPGAKCVVTNATESFCVPPCSDDADCGKGFSCIQVSGKLPGTSTSQCIPDDLSCYY